MTRWPFAALAAAFACGAAPALADLAVTANDSHSVNVNGAVTAAKNPKPDTVSVIDVGQYPPKVVATVEAPTSVVGAPTSIWISPDESWVIVTAATKIDPADPDKIVDDDRVSVIDLKASPPKVVQQVAAGAGANEISVSPDGTLALVTNRAEGTLSVFTVADKRLTAVGKVDLGNPKSMPSSVKFLHGGKTALVSRYGDNQVGVLHLDGTKVTVDERKIVTGVSPYTLDINGDGTLAAVANMGGGGNGDIDVVSLIDLTQNPLRAVEAYAPGISPEGLKFSPDGKFLAAACIEGSTRPGNSPFYHDHGRLVLLAVEGKKLRPVAEAPIGRWSQGIAFSRDGKTALVGSMIDRGLDVFRWEDGKLTAGAVLGVDSGPAAIRTSWP
ncbi:MAG: beta-propeller fold lactonase family protein [Alphaproteobacteria bacterium]|nr:beta-propeller fold lactonase family protein [Alphaproteobacteria bacterium]